MNGNYKFFTCLKTSMLRNLFQSKKLNNISLYYILSFDFSHWLSLQKQPPEVFCKKSVIRNFAKFTRKHLCQSLFFNKVAGLITPFIQNTSRRLARWWFLSNFTRRMFYINFPMIYTKVFVCKFEIMFSTD